MMQSQHVVGEVLLSRSTSPPVALLLYPASAHSNLAFDGQANAAMAFFWHCAGVLAHIALASLPASSCPCCRHCAGVVAKLTFEGPAGAALAFAGVALAFCLHLAGIIASIVLLSLLPALCRRHPPRCIGAFALVPLALFSLLPLRCRQHRKLASVQSRSSHNTRWRHFQNCAIVIAGIAPASLPSLCRHLCPHWAGVAALSTPTLLPASQTGIRPVMTQSQHVAGEALLLRSLSLPVASLLYPALAHSDLAFDSLAKAAMAFFWRCAGVLARIALASLPASSCPCCWHCAGIVAELAFESPAGTALAFAGVALAFCLHCAGVIASIMLLPLLPTLCRRCCPRRMAIFALIVRPSWWRLPFHRRCHMWRPCRNLCCLCPSSIFCCLMPLRQCTCLLP